MIKKLDTNGKNVEIRILSDGFIEIKGKIDYYSESGTLFDKKRRTFFVEKIASRAFSKCLEKQEDIPYLLFNHDWKFKNKIESFEFKDDDTCFVFTYIVEASEMLIELLPQISNFSFGFLIDEDDWKPTKGTMASYERIIKSFRAITEFSLLHGLESAYPCAKVFLNEEEMKREELESFVINAKAFIKEQRIKDLEKLKSSVLKLRA